jgi:hypothetical protein
MNKQFKFFLAFKNCKLKRYSQNLIFSQVKWIGKPQKRHMYGQLKIAFHKERRKLDVRE